MASNGNREAKAPAYKSELFIITGGNLKFQAQKNQLKSWFNVWYQRVRLVSLATQLRPAARHAKDGVAG